MDFEILYRKLCGYRQRAEDLAAELRDRFDARVSIQEGTFGQFDVLLGGTLVASKGRLLRRVLVHDAPPQGELIESIERHLATRTGDACELPASGRG